MLARIERLIFGASAEERVERLTKLIDQGVARALDRAFAGLDADADADSAAFAAADESRQQDATSGKEEEAPHA